MASDEEYSDLTELESDEEYGETSNKKGKKPAHAGWRIRNALKVPRATTYTAQALYDQIYGCDINLEPEYQRDVVWSEAKQIGIIDSVFRNFYIPPVIFAVNVQEDGSETKTCIDGKQRLTSIHKFMEGQIPHKDPITGEKLYYKDIQGTGPKRKLLPEKYRRLFANKQIVCVEYQDITDADEREIFQRVQLGMALTPAEKLQVLKTPRTDFARDLQNRYAKEDGWLGPKHLAWDVSRGSDFRGIAHAVCCMDTYATLKTGSMGMSQLEKWLSIDEPLKPATKKAVEEAYRLFAAIVQDKNLNKVLQTPAKISPVEFIGIAIMIYAHKDKASLAQLAAGILEMRQHVRKLHVDVRMNTRVSKTMLEFIKSWVPKGEGIKGGTSTKRKRASKKAVVDAGEDEDEDLEMDDDDEHDGDGDDAYAPKAKKKNTGKSANAEASTSKATPPVQVKRERAQSPSVSADPVLKAGMGDRMAAMKLAKAKIAHSQAERAKQIPTGPRALRGEATPNPQMLPSPTQQYALPSNLAAALNHRSPLPGSASAGQAAGSPSGESSRPSHLPPLPASSASAASDGAYRNDRDKGRERAFDEDRDADRSRARERSRERDRGYARGRDERDRPRDPRDPTRRDSGVYSRPRSPAPSSRWAPR